MSDLREQIAQRLYETGTPFFDWLAKDPGGWEGLKDKKRLRTMADEVIRLMEWARLSEPMVAGLTGCGCGWMHVAGHPVFDQPGHRMLEVGEKMPLSLPPPEWKP